MNDFLNTKKLREFGFLIGFFTPIFLGFIIPYIQGHNFNFWTLYIGIPFLILGLIAPKVLIYPYKFWMSLGKILGWINTRLILGLVFIFVVQPIAFFMRVFGYDPLQQKKSKKSSYREIRKHSKIDLRRIF